MNKTITDILIPKKKSSLSERIKHLREMVLSSKPTVCTQRARFYTQSYKDHEDKPVLLKRAYALENTLKHMTIFINEGELIVGNHSSTLRAAPIFPEYAVEWVLKELDEFEKRPGDAFFLTESVKNELKEICTYWEGKTTLSKGRALMSPELKEIHSSGIIRAEGNLTSGDAHIAINNKQLLQYGLDKYIFLVKEHQSKLEITKREDLKKQIYYQGTEIALKAFQSFILRFSQLAKELGNKEKNRERKNELEQISSTCEKISSKPPTSFYEALQLTYFVQLVLQIESNGHSMSLGRMDQYLYPFYLEDKQKGLITDEEVMELFENTWIKLLSINKIRSWSHTRYSAGSPLYQNVTIGGQTQDKKDGVNELSYLILWSVGETKLTQPNLSVRFHKNMRNEFLYECIKVIEKGFGMPAFNNDEIVIPAFKNLGVEETDAYDYSAIGCIEVAVPGKWGYRCTGKHFINFMRVFMAALNNGKDNISEKTFYPGIGSLLDFEDFDSVMDAWKLQIKNYAKAGVAIDTAIDIVLEEEAPDILCSAFVDDCLLRGKTIHEGGSKYDFVSGLQVGIANLGNSLAAIKKLIFEESKISKEELMKHLENNFEGIEGEKIRQILLNNAPKFGNDDDYVDQLLRKAYLYYIDELDQYRTIRDGRGPIGCRYYAGTSSISANVPSGAVVKATPDGRNSGKPLAEGSSPSSGTDVNGPTAVFKSVSKLPTDKILGGVLLNQKLNPQVLKNDEDKLKLIDLIKSFFGILKGWHIQYNIVDRKTLLAAKKASRTV
jgi:formate C-acetyltransferase